MKLFCYNKDAIVDRIAFCGGSGASFIDDVINQNAQVYITGDIKYHDAQHAIANGLTLIDLGHYNTENIFVEEIYNYLINKNSFRVYKILNNVTYEDYIWLTFIFKCAKIHDC